MVNTRKQRRQSRHSRGAGSALAIRAWARRHVYSFFSSLGALVRSPLGTLMTVVVLGIALALPLGLWVGLKNIQQVNPATEDFSSISVFLNSGTDTAAATQLAAAIQSWPEVDKITSLSPAEALTDFRENSGFAAAVDALSENPLPWVLEIQLLEAAVGSAAESKLQFKQQLDKLLSRLQELPGVEFAQYDLKWLERLHALMSLGESIGRLLALLFGFAVIFVVGNTIRLDIHNRKEEIEVMSLVGATEAFIRRPFLYTGFWYGLFGGMVAVILVSIALALIRSPLDRLLLSYQSEFELITPGFSGGLLVLLTGGVLGLLGAALAVRRHLQNLNPT
ncbi:MAG: permease-like cell division protein FtsX [Xanthomonadales bacterium]|nr:permease-like cell division protein FtsX [Xanthomonadales bacterium]